MPSYHDEFARSIADPDGFWGDQARLVDWIRRPNRVLDDSAPPFYRWFPDATLNTCYNALDRHVVKGRADQPALIHDSPVTGTMTTSSGPRSEMSASLFLPVRFLIPNEAI